MITLEVRCQIAVMETSCLPSRTLLSTVGTRAAARFNTCNTTCSTCSNNHHRYLTKNTYVRCKVRGITSQLNWPLKVRYITKVARVGTNRCSLLDHQVWEIFTPEWLDNEGDKKKKRDRRYENSRRKIMRKYSAWRGCAFPGCNSGNRAQELIRTSTIQNTNNQVIPRRLIIHPMCANSYVELFCFLDFTFGATCTFVLPCISHRTIVLPLRTSCPVIRSEPWLMVYKLRCGRCLSFSCPLPSARLSHCQSLSRGWISVPWHSYSKLQYIMFGALKPYTNYTRHQANGAVYALRCLRPRLSFTTG